MTQEQKGNKMTINARMRKYYPRIWALHYNYIVKPLGKWRENDTINYNQYEEMLSRLNNLLIKNLGL